MSISYNLRGNISRNMAPLSLRSSLRILWTVVAALVFLTKSSAAPTFGGISQATVSFFFDFFYNRYYSFIRVQYIFEWKWY